MNQQSVIAQVVSLQDYSIKELKELWQELFGTPSPHNSHAYLIRRVSYRLQENAYGSISKEAENKLDTLANLMKKGKGVIDPNARRKLLPGTVLTGKFKGVVYKAMVIKGGFVYEEQPYNSLSAIGRKITGSQCNGWRFFKFNNVIEKIGEKVNEARL